MSEKSVAETATELDENVVEKTVHALEKLGLEFASPTNPKLEKFGLGRFAAYEQKLGALDTTEIVHILDEGERERIRALSRKMILWAFAIGALSGLVSAIASALMTVPDQVATTFGEDLLAFIVNNAVTIGATAIEVAILYRIALRTVHLIAREAGIRLAPPSGDTPDSDERRAVALALARAALELPNPPQNPFGINPYKEISTFRMVLATLVFKLKISLTNIVLRFVVRRVGGRTVLKAYLPFTDIFATGAWDAAVAWRMVRQARIRALGPSACEMLVADILRDQKSVRRDVFVVMLRAVASCVVRNRDVHPNLLALMRSIVRRLGKAEVKDLDDTQAFLVALDGLAPHERYLVLEVLVLATFPDGHVSRAEVKLLTTILERYQGSIDVVTLKTVCRRFVRGDRLDRQMLQAVLRLPPMKEIHGHAHPHAR